MSTRKPVAIITGGSSGIGLALAANFQTRGYQAVSWDLQGPLAADMDSIQHIKCDIGSERAVLDAHNETCERFGEPSILINNAGLQFMAPIEEFPYEKWQLLVNVILTGTFLCSRAVIPAMKHKGWGRIVNISSIHGKVASPYKAAYVAAKHGVLGLSKVMAQELGSHGITVNSICPGFVETPLLEKQISRQAELNGMSPEHVRNEIMLKPQVVKRFTSVEQVANLVKFLCSDDASTITGEAYNMAGGWGMGT